MGSGSKHRSPPAHATAALANVVSAVSWIDTAQTPAVVITGHAPPTGRCTAREAILLGRVRVVTRTAVDGGVIGAVVVGVRARPRGNAERAAGAQQERLRVRANVGAERPAIPNGSGPIGVGDVVHGLDLNAANRLWRRWGRGASIPRSKRSRRGRWGCGRRPSRRSRRSNRYRRCRRTRPTNADRRARRDRDRGFASWRQ